MTGAVGAARTPLEEDVLAIGRRRHLAVIVARVWPISCHRCRIDAADLNTDGFGTIWPASGILVAALLIARPGQAVPHLVLAGLASLAANLLSGVSSSMR
ncbi:hypothetical protein AB5I41_12350 [Sphingomonas sp. MMS24-JH45]